MSASRIVTIPIDDILLDSLSLDAVQAGLIGDNENIIRINEISAEGIVAEVEDVDMIDDK